MCSLAYGRHVRGMGVEQRAAFDHYLLTGELPDGGHDGADRPAAGQVPDGGGMSAAALREALAHERIVPPD